MKLIIKFCSQSTLKSATDCCQMERQIQQAVREAATICSQYAPAPCKFFFDLLTLKVVSESHVTWANFSLPRPLCSRLRPDIHDRR